MKFLSMLSVRLGNYPAGLVGRILREWRNVPWHESLRPDHWHPAASTVLNISLVLVLGHIYFANVKYHWSGHGDKNRPYTPCIILLQCHLNPLHGFVLILNNIVDMCEIWYRWHMGNISSLGLPNLLLNQSSWEASSEVSFVILQSLIAPGFVCSVVSDFVQVLD